MEGEELFISLSFFAFIRLFSFLFFFEELTRRKTTLFLHLTPNKPSSRLLKQRLSFPRKKEEEEAKPRETNIFSFFRFFFWGGARGVSAGVEKRAWKVT